MADNVPFLIINPNAKDKRLGKKLDRILESAKNAFGDFQYGLTTKIGDGIPIAKKAISEGYNTLVSVGGDGTLNELINVAAKTDVKVGMIPGGSACDSLKTHGIPNDFDRAFELNFRCPKCGGPLDAQENQELIHFLIEKIVLIDNLDLPSYD